MMVAAVSFLIIMGVVDTVAVFIDAVLFLFMTMVMVVMMLVLILVVIMVVMVVMVLVLILIVIMVMVMMVLVLILIVIMVMMVMMVLVLILVLIMVMMVVMVLVLILVVIMVVMVVMVLMLIVIMVMMMLVLVLIVIVGVQDFFQKSFLQVGCSLNGIKDHIAVQFSDRCCDNRGVLVVFTKELDTLRDLLVTDFVCPGQDDRSRIGDLIVEELAEILEVNLALGGIHDCACTVEMHLGVLGSIVDGTHDIGELADTGGLDQDALRFIGSHDFSQRSAEITDQ
jgi:hypothetical protein